MNRTAVLLLLAVLTAAGLAQVGVVDTIGGTTFDNQNSGPAYQWLATDADNGIHATWMFSAEPQSSGWPDRTVNYNFFDPSNGQWFWIQPGDYMASGLNSQERRTGYGTLELDPSGGAAMVACHYNAGGMPPQFTATVTRDLAPGAGIFDECVGAPNLIEYFLPVIAATGDRTLHLLVIKFQASDNLYYSRSTAWCTWESPSGWSQTGASGHNIFASHQSNRVLATWMTGNNESLALGYRYSTDAGANWGPVQQLTPPSAFGGDTLTVCSRGASGLFDADDDWVLATTLLPVVADSAHENPAELWLYHSGTSQWSRIHRAESHSLAGGFGSHAAICDRPSLGYNPENGRFYVAWEQFDSSNVEPSTGLLRAEVWTASSADGSAWSNPVRLTDPGTSSKRFPSLGRDCRGDSLAVGWLEDLIAGFHSDEVGAESDNPICVWRGTVDAITEGEPARVTRLSARPNPGRRFRFTGLSRTGATVDVYDSRGRLVRRLSSTPGLTWDGRDDAGSRVRPGCYFARCRGAAAAPLKLVVLE